MRYVPLSTIKIHPDRQRQHFDPERLADLQSSIERLGLIQPLVIAEDGTLVAGERRLKSIETLQMLGSVLLFNGELIPDGTVPAILPNENHQLAMFEIELEENIKRHDLTWQEHSAALAKLNQLRSLQALEAGTIPPTVADLALEIEGRNDGAY